MTKSTPAGATWPVSLRAAMPWLVLAVVWLLVVSLTHPVSTSDTLLYVESVSARFRGLNYQFWDFGHLFWRPLATLMARAATAITGSTDPRIAILGPMVGLNILTSLGCAFLLILILRRLHPGMLPAWAVALAFLMTHGTIVYAQNGTAYMSGLLLVLIGILFALRGADAEQETGNAILAGVAAALAAAFWFNYVIVIPAVAVAAIVMGKRWNFAAGAIVLLAAAVTGCVSFIGTALAIGIRTPAEFWEWFQAASHGIQGVNGVPRAVLGFARSLLFVGEDGGVMRRFLTRDPYAPVTFAELARTRIWLLGVIWLVAISTVLWALKTRRHYRLLIVCTAAALPVGVFAVAWQGGDVPRWFPLYPFLFMLVHAVLTDRGARPLRYLMIGGLAFMAVSNTVLLSEVAAQRTREMALQRLAGMDALLRDNDLMFASHYQDDIVQIQNMFPLQPLYASRTPVVHVIVELNAPQVDRWQRVFARRVQRAWNNGWQVWISKRVFAEKPQADWEWIEGTDPRIGWRHFHEFFKLFETTDPAGTIDGFVRLEQTPHNESLLTAQLENR